MRTFATTRYFPFLCESCHSIVTLNLLDRDHLCPSCGSSSPIPYDTPRLAKSPGPGVVAGWDLTSKIGRDVVLTDGNYLCPSCGQMSLQFRDTGLRWD
jgi:predicted RNA-binding Zn-ribbon protein involved in translation (DUF1610 family)